MLIWPRPVRSMFLPLLALCLGCETTEPVEFTPTVSTSPERNQRTDLEQGLDFLSRLDEFETMQVHQKIQYHLQQWLKSQKPQADWAPDAVAAQLPERYRPLASNAQLSRLEFEPYDIQMLQEATWMRDVATSVIQMNQVPPGLHRKLEEATSGMDAGVARDLAHATQLFDWTVRNLLLDGTGEQNDTRRTPEPMLLQAWESLMMGRGTVDEKCRVFMLLARQGGLPVVMLGVISEEKQAIRSWLPALLLGDQLYLFDMRLGVPLQQPESPAFATLGYVLDHPELLETLAEQSGEAYPVAADDLQRLVALIDATPGYLSQRMRMLESALAGDTKTVLTVSPSALAARLGNVRGIGGVAIWPLPYEAYAIRGTITENANALRWLAMEHRLFDRRTPLAKARQLQFRGQFEPKDDLPGASQYYLQCRPTDAQIDAIRNAPLRLPEDAPAPTEEQLAAYNNRLADLEQLMIRTKQNASFWLGVMAFDRGEYLVAADYFGKRLVTPAHPVSMWITAGHYNSGRTFEALARQQETRAGPGEDDADRDRQTADGYWQQALTAYRAVQKSPWTPACNLRANAIESRLAEP